MRRIMGSCKGSAVMDELKKLRLAVKTKDTQIKRLLQENKELTIKVQGAERIKRIAMDSISENVKVSMDVLMNKELVEMEEE